MRDPELVFKAQLAASALERAWQRWRVMHGLVADPMPAISSYVGYSVEEPWGQPRVVFGLSAKDAEQLAALLNRHDCIGPVHATRAGQQAKELPAGVSGPLAVPPQVPSVVAELSSGGAGKPAGKVRRSVALADELDGPVYRQMARAAREAARQAAAANEHARPVVADTAVADTVQADAVQENTGDANTAEADTVQAGPVQARTVQARTEQARTEQARTEQTDAGQAAAAHSGALGLAAVEADGGAAVGAQAEPERAVVAQAEDAADGEAAHVAAVKAETAGQEAPVEQTAGEPAAKAPDASGETDAGTGSTSTLGDKAGSGDDGDDDGNGPGGAGPGGGGGRRSGRVVATAGRSRGRKGGESSRANSSESSRADSAGAATPGDGSSAATSGSAGSRPAGEPGTPAGRAAHAQLAEPGGAPDVPEVPDGPGPLALAASAARVATEARIRAAMQRGRPAATQAAVAMPEVAAGAHAVLFEDPPEPEYEIEIDLDVASAWGGAEFTAQEVLVPEDGFAAQAFAADDEFAEEDFAAEAAADPDVVPLRPRREDAGDDADEDPAAEDFPEHSPSGTMRRNRIARGYSIPRLSRSKRPGAIPGL